MNDAQSAAAEAALRCARCHTELAPAMLGCPACRTLVHADRLRELAAAAHGDVGAGRLEDARGRWYDALELLPAASRQHEQVRQRILDLTARIDAGAGVKTPGTADVANDTSASTATQPAGSLSRRAIAIGVTVCLFALTKLKFLVLGLTKASTFFSMFAFFGVYWSLYGWRLAGGLALSIYIHEMGHVAELRRLGIRSGAPLFIPGIGAMVLLRQRIVDPVIDARIGLAGPVWGLGAGVAAYGAFLFTGAPIWAAIAQLTGILNMFNLIPIWQLDGSRGFHALSSDQRWTVVLGLGAAYLFTHQGLLLIVAAVGAFRALQSPPGPGHARTLVTFLALIAALSWLSGVPGGV